eukprot:TRINITY_DN24918_c0_g1_i1.p1 TRINITY_DN24918_c0_g1~~TRINITY_DN24918_c0_g1_i1.p1  ORF type:complete len:606 (+),score=119.78 TRINITY_DN24918_c0_g1_i1:42-1820(+)
MASVASADSEDCGHLYGFGDPSPTRTKLQEIVEQRRQDVEEARGARPEAQLITEAKAFEKDNGPPQSFIDCLEKAESSPWGVALAAEFKRASPSKGDINASLDAAQQALEYTSAGANILSVLTEPKWFKGSLEDLRDVRLKTQFWAKTYGRGRPACLRKDFVVDEYQVLEALAHGADTILLMVSILSRSRLRALITCCRSHGIEPLVEVVTMRELDVALNASARVIGVNNRNLHTFELHKGRTAEIAKELTDRRVPFGQGAATKLLALSGLATNEDVKNCRLVGCSGVLIGEALMRAPDPGVAILELMGTIGDVAVLPVPPGAVIVKVCGVVRAEDAQCAVAAGANLIGVIFAVSKRQASVDAARNVVDIVRRFGERTEAVHAAEASKDGAETSETAEAFRWRCGALRQACRRTPLVVGVFMNQTLDDVVEKVHGSGVDAVQLHGGEELPFIEELRKRLPHVWLIKVVHLPPKRSGDAEWESSSDLDELRVKLEDYRKVCDAVLLDTAVKGCHSGGTGAAFDWALAKRVQDEWGVPVIVAGGLTDENVAELVTSIGPFGVDVASGVEHTTGVKSAEKSSAYVQNAKRARVQK